jgi:hypothetical protein
MFARRTPRPGSGLHRCCACHGDFVVPLWRESLAGGRWRLLLRCGQCQRYRDVVVGEAVADALDRDVERGRAEIAASLDRSVHAQMVAELQVFVIALERDLIDATDFAPR